MVSYHRANFDCHRYCRSVDVSFLNLSRDHLIKRSRNFKGGVPPLQVTTLSSLVAIVIPEGQYMALHLSHDNVTKKSRNLVNAVTHTMSPPFVRKM